MIGYLTKKIFGSRNDRYLKKLLPVVARINALEDGMAALADADFPARIAALREEVASGRSLDDLLPEVFALTREAGKRALGMRHFDVQLMGGMILHQGKIAEIKTCRAFAFSKTGRGCRKIDDYPVSINYISKTAM